MTLRVLITGAGGFAGSHLVAYLRSYRDCEIWGCGLNTTMPAHLDGLIHYQQVDLRDAANVTALVSDIAPDHIYHLAGQASPAASVAQPWETLESNLRPQVYLLEAARHLNPMPRMLVVSSAEVYGRSGQGDEPVREQHPFLPQNPYAVSKVGQDVLGAQYYRSTGLPVLIVRPFNHIGPGQSRQFVAPAFARQVALIEAGHQAPVMRVGNLSSLRDFSDVRDIVRAYAWLMADGEPGEPYNVGSGTLRTVQSILDVLLRAATVSIDVQVDESLLRANDPPGLRADIGKVNALTGWQPEIDFETSIVDLLEFERQQVRHAQTTN